MGLGGKRSSGDHIMGRSPSVGTIFYHLRVSPGSRLSIWADLSSLFGEFRTKIEDGYV